MIEATPIYTWVAANVPHPFDPHTSIPSRCRKCGKTRRAGIHAKREAPTCT